jgi:hypothetical protein
MTIERDRLCRPPPQDAVHVLQPVKNVVQQSTGHGLVPQTAVSDCTGHSTPPNNAGVITERERDFEPVPHDAEHFLHAPQLVTLQSLGHGMLLQGCTSASVGHLMPPYAGWVEMPRVRLCMPIPQLLEQVSHATKSATTQSIGHTPVLHAFVSNSVGQASPP